MDPWDDGGPEVIDLEEVAVGAGMEMVIRPGSAAGHSTSMPSNIRDSASADRRLDANASVFELDISHESQPIQDSSTEMPAAESEKEDSPVGAETLSVSCMILEHEEVHFRRLRAQGSAQRQMMALPRSVLETRKVLRRVRHMQRT